MRVYDALPPASVRIGFYRAAGVWKDTAVIEHGPEGTMHYVQSNVRGETSHFFATGLKEHQIIFGDTENLEKAILEVDQKRKPSLMIVMSSPVSEIIGVDLKAVCFKMQSHVQASLSVLDQLPAEGSETQGKSIAYKAAAAFLKNNSPKLPDVQKSGALILGLSEVDYNGISDLNEIRRMLQDYFGIPLLNDELGRYNLCDVKKAQWILAVEPEAAVLAAMAKELWDIPWYQGIPYGVDACKALVSAVEQATGVSPSALWKQDLKEASFVTRQFSSSMENRRRRRVFLDVRPSRMNALERFIKLELGMECIRPSDRVSALSTNGAVNRNPEIMTDDILLGSGLLCMLHDCNPSICMEDPVVRHKAFSRHLPLMGIWGAENVLSLLYSCLL